MSFGIKQQKDIQIDSTDVSTATYTVLSSDDFVRLSYTATGAVTVTLPTALLNNKKELTIKDVGGNAGTNNITINTEGAEKIDGEDSLIINTNYDWTKLYPNGSSWDITS